MRPDRHALVTALLAWHAHSGRSQLPWRRDRDPYRIVVSEFMLQQTQVERVVPIFERFVAAYPGFATLAAASRADVVRAWKGLGYNSRALRLHAVATAVVERFDGTLPRDEATLRGLPGIGPYTARAVAAFAFDADAVAMDTNVRRVVHRTRYGVEWPRRANDADLDAEAAELLPPGDGFAFNSALMDLGATYCSARAPKCLVCPLRDACVAAPIDPASLARLATAHAAPRSPQERLPFEQTTRYVRGRVVDRLRALSPNEHLPLNDLRRALGERLEHPDEALMKIVAGLVNEGVVEENERGLRLSP